jgi:hypothetical protein
MLVPLLFFGVVTFGLGYTVLWLSRASRAPNPFLGVLETAGVGLAAFSFLGVVLNALHVPLRPLPYLVVAALGPVASLVVSLARKKEPSEPKPEWDTEETLCAIALEVVLILFFMIYRHGANAYPYLEGEDPCMHAEAALYVAKLHTFSVDPAVRAMGDFAFYLEPYPPTYDVIMGVLRQMNPSVYSTLKLFNVLMVTLALGFSYLLCREYLQSARKALMAALILAVLPSFMSHFIWSQTLAMCVFPVAMYATMKALDDKSWTVAAVVTVASLIVTQPVVSAMAGGVFLLLVIFVFAREAAEADGSQISSFPQTVRTLVIGASGAALSLLYWGPQIAKWGIGGMMRLKGDELSTKWQSAYSLRHYTLDETLFPHVTKSDQATGWGVVVAAGVLLGLVALALRPKDDWRPLHLFAWFAALFYIVFAPSFGLPSWGSDRAWAYLAVPVALLASEGIFALAALLGKDTPLGPALIFGAAIGIVATSSPAKVEAQTGVWPAGGSWPTLDPGSPSPVLQGFVQMRKMLEPNTRVYPFCASASRSIGFDMDATPWAPAEAAFRARGGKVTPDEAIAFLDTERYAYFAFDVNCETDWGRQTADGFVERLGGSSRVKPVIVQPGFVLAQIVPSRAAAQPPDLASQGPSP